MSIFNKLKQVADGVKDGVQDSLSEIKEETKRKDCLDYVPILHKMAKEDGRCPVCGEVVQGVSRK